MRGKTIFASLVTLAFMCSFVFATLAGLVLASGEVHALFGLAIGIALTVGWATLMWLVSPWIMDLCQRWFYSARPITLQELGQMRPAVAQLIQNICGRHRIKVPALKFIDDGTPQAYCYGSYANNARLVVTKGLVDTLDDEELKAVCAHELGHIVHRDFIVMTVASTLLSVLWFIYIYGKRIKWDNKRPFYFVALAAYVFHWISQYLLLYLSRTREYYADDFAGQETGNPNALSMALIKIAYGLTQIEQSPLRQQLLGDTRALGISDARGASGVGWAYRAANTPAQPVPQPQPAYAGGYQGQPAPAQPYPAAQGYGPGGQAQGAVPYGQPAAPYGPGAPAYGHAQGTGAPPYGAQPYAASAQAAAPSVTWEGVRNIQKVMLFDLYNPWATICELVSTHPLTGRRIYAMCRLAVSRGQPPLVTFEQVDASGKALDKARLYGAFLFEVTIHFLPYIFAAMFVILSLGCAALERFELTGLFAVLIVFGVGLGMTVKGFYRFPSLGTPPATTVLELMSDPYASPLKGRPVMLDGVVTGRASAGGRFDEDFVITDRSGGLIMINYESVFGWIGNLFFANRVGNLINQRVRVVGWFRRGISQQVDLKSLQAQDGGQTSSWTSFWGKASGVLVLLFGIVAGLATALTLSSASDAASPNAPSAATAATAPQSATQRIVPTGAALGATPTGQAAASPTGQSPAGSARPAPKPAAPAAKPAAKPPSGASPKQGPTR